MVILMGSSMRPKRSSELGKKRIPPDQGRRTTLNRLIHSKDFFWGSMIIACMIVLLLIIATYPFPKAEVDRFNWAHVGYIPSNVDSNYDVGFIPYRHSPKSLDAITFYVIDKSEHPRSENYPNLAVEWADPSNRSIRLMGTLSDIHYSDSEFDDAQVSNGTWFYSRGEAYSEEIRNLTLCICYRDDDANFRTGGNISIRSQRNGGATTGGYYLILRSHGEDSTFVHRLWSIEDY